MEGMFTENSDEPHAEVIARAIYLKTSQGIDISSTTLLKEIIAEALDFLPEKTRKEEVKKSCQRCFQALRIDVNSEFDFLYEFLEKLPEVLAPGGRVAILSFHSGEDRLVKKSFKHFFREGIYREIAQGPIRPSAEECNTNSRARSAKLRWAVKN
jgi:16S rRNA (cytosine1402-N4)-methyltransferase